MAHTLQHPVTVQISAHTASPQSQRSLMGMVSCSPPLPNPCADTVPCPAPLWHSPGWHLLLQLWMTCCSLSACSLDLPDLRHPPKSLLVGSVDSPQGWGPCPGRGGDHKAVVSDQSLCIYRRHIRGIYPLTYKISLLPIVKCLLYSLAQNSVSAKIPLIVWVICRKIG